jgi:hypothetical protein
LQASFDAPKGHPVDYKVPNFGVDKEILASQLHEKKAEKQLKKKLVGDFFDDQTPKYKLDYKVPNFGLDTDIKNTVSSLKSTEKKLGNWNPKKDSDGAFVVPTSVALQTNAELAMESDPICSSAGCTQYEHPKMDSHPVDYFVPNFGVDQGIIDHNTSLAIAEKQLKHKLVIEDMPKIERDYPVVNYGVDKDILETQASIAKSEADLGAWTPKQDENGYWKVPEAFSASSYNYHDRDVFVQLDE